MKKTFLITGSTDGIGLATARRLVAQGHHVLVHGRNEVKLRAVAKELDTEGYVADLSRLEDVKTLARQVNEKHTTLNVLINNAGVLQAHNATAPTGQDLRFVVNTIAPYLLTKQLLPLMTSDGRIVNLSSAAQAPVDLAALAGQVVIADDFAAYAQSKLAITMWTHGVAHSLPSGPMVVAVNPGSLLGTKMVREGFGRAGNDVGMGVDILCRAALSDEFADVSGRYFDNDSGRFTSPHPDALDLRKCEALIRVIETSIGD